MQRIFCVAFSVLLVSCAPPKRPDGEICALNVPKGICHRLQIPEHEDGEWKYLGDRPLTDVDKYFALSPEYMLKLKNYVKDLREWAEKKCSK